MIKEIEKIYSECYYNRKPTDKEIVDILELNVYKTGYYNILGNNTFCVIETNGSILIREFNKDLLKEKIEKLIFNKK